MKKVTSDKLNALYNAISSKYPLYLPIRRANEVNYSLYREGDDVDLDTLRTNKSPKDVFFPQSENLMKFKVYGQKIEVIDIRTESKPFVVMGVKACDYKAFDILDRVFLVDPLDTYYATKREAGIVITMACDRPDESCFCFKMDVDPTEPKGDISTFRIGQDLFWRENTEKGIKLTEELSEFFTEEDDSIVKFQQDYMKDFVKKLPLYNLNPDYFKSEEMLKIFNSPKWNALSEACLGCGTCTFVCPTCQCFDIREFVGNGDVKRFRCWDSCMYSDFTKTAGGQPRTTQMQRYRQRFMHKLVYYPENNEGIYSCVGCGRCLKKCPQGLNIAKVIKEFGGKDDE